MSEDNKFSLKETSYAKICLSDKVNDLYNTNILTEFEGIHKLINIFQIHSVILQNNSMKIIFSKKINLENFKINDKLIFKGLKIAIGDKEPYDIDNNYDDFIDFLENNEFIINSINDDTISVEINNFLNMNGILSIKGSCLNKSRIPNISINYNIKYP